MFGPFLKFISFKILSPLKIYFMYYAGKRPVLATHISFKKMVWYISLLEFNAKNYIDKIKIQC